MVEGLRRIMNEFIILQKPSTYMLNNLSLIVYYYQYPVDLVNLRPINLLYFFISVFCAYLFTVHRLRFTVYRLLRYKPLWLAAIAAEIDDEAHLDPGRPEEVDHALFVSSAEFFFALEVHDHLFVDEYAGQIARNGVALVVELNGTVGLCGNTAELKFFEESFFVHVFKEAIPKDFIDLQGCTDDLVGQVFEYEGLIVCSNTVVHCSFPRRKKVTSNE